MRTVRCSLRSVGPQLLARLKRENFSTTLPAPEGELVQQIVHDDYNFEFLGLAGDVREDRVERSLIAELEQISAGVHRIVERHADEVAEAEADPHRLDPGVPGDDAQQQP